MEKTMRARRCSSRAGSEARFRLGDGVRLAHMEPLPVEFETVEAVLARWRGRRTALAENGPSGVSCTISGFTMATPA